PAPRSCKHPATVRTTRDPDTRTPYSNHRDETRRRTSAPLSSAPRATDDTIPRPIPSAPPPRHVSPACPRAPFAAAALARENPDLAPPPAKPCAPRPRPCGCPPATLSETAAPARTVAA